MGYSVKRLPVITHVVNTGFPIIFVYMLKVIHKALHGQVWRIISSCLNTAL